MVKQQALALVRSVLQAEGASSTLSLPADQELVALCRWLHEDQLLGFLYDTLAASDGLGRLPPRLRFYLLTGFTQQKQANQIVIEEAGHLSRLFANRPETLVFFKGPVVAHRFYGGLFRRSYFDLDVLVAEDELATVASVLHEAGWQGEAAPFPSHEIKYHKGPLQLDVHHRVRLDAHYQPNTAGMLSRRIQETVGDSVVWTLCDEDHLAALIALLFYDVLGGKSSFRQVLDVYYALRRVDGLVDWPRFMADREREGLGTIAPAMLHLVLTLLDVAAHCPGAGAWARPSCDSHDYLWLIGRPQGSRWARLRHRARVYRWAATLYQPQEPPNLYLVKRAISHAHWRWRVRHMDPSELS